MNGHDVYYMPREDWDATDQLYGENIASRFERAYQIEMYITTTKGFSGQGDWFSKFGLEVRENADLVVAKKSFERVVPSNIARRPRDGDLIFIPVMNKIVEISFVEDEMMFFTLGRKYPYIYELRCRDFRASNEKINTGIDVIDVIDDSYVYAITMNVSSAGYMIGEEVWQGTDYANAVAKGTVTDIDPVALTMSVKYVNGKFEPAANVIGVSSNVSSNVRAIENYAQPTYYDFSDNKIIQQEANNIVVLDSNPFGNPS